MSFVPVLRAAAIAAIPFLLSACGPANVMGTWTGTWSLSDNSAGGTISLDLQQDGRNVSGSFSLGGSICVNSGTVDGTIAGQKLDVTISNGVGGNAHLTGTVDAAAANIDGDFDVTTGLCSGATGSFHVSH
jgi:hypothetical protein